MTNKKKRVYYIISLLTPVLFFLLLEAGLRLFDYDPQPELFIEDLTDNEFLVLNPEVTKRYFREKEFATKGQYDIFRKAKSNKTFRIVVQGASTTAGFPYAHGASFPRLLEQKLQFHYPDLDLEVINTSMAAVNSFTLLDFSEEIIEQQPDLIILYAGHNEYYGALGVGSSQSFAGSAGLTNFYLKLKKIRTMRLLKNLMASIRSSAVPEDRETLMGKMVKNTSIEHGSDVYQAGIDQYKSNISALLAKYNNSDVPVFICTLFSNLKDFEPFESSEGEVKSAEFSFLEGKRELGLGNLEKAKENFERAKDYDLLKFRAPTELENIIPELAQEFGAKLIDTRRGFEVNSEDQIVGNNLLLEHVHPNLNGQRLFSDLVFESVRTHLESKGFRTNQPDNFEGYAISYVDSLYGTKLIDQLSENWPFVDRVNENSRKIDNDIIDKLISGEVVWVEAMNTVYNSQMTDDFPGAIKTAKTLLQEYPHQTQPYIMLANALAKTGEFDQSIKILNRVPSKIHTIAVDKQKLSVFLQKQDYKESEVVAQGVLNKENNTQNRRVVQALRDINAVDLANIDSKSVTGNPSGYISALGALSYLQQLDKARELNAVLLRLIPKNEQLIQLNKILNL